jgi:5-methylcytosine-specific restriction endonuclease McrA
MPLVLDHIDGNSDNWDLKNLRMICCNCDALTPTYKNRNRGNGRFLRRIRYREGKSY